VATRRRPTERDTVRALWLLGLRDPQGVAEIRQAWKDRVAQTHPDRRLEQNEAANRLTAAFNDARDVCERWAESGLPWPEPKRAKVIRFEAPRRARTGRRAAGVPSRARTRRAENGAPRCAPGTAFASPGVATRSSASFG
jgi:hypothetical protein